MELLKQGAEARVYKQTFLSKPSIVKQRFKKTYRHPVLDNKLTHRRTLQEARSMVRCRKAGIRTPLVYFIDYETHSIYMEEIVNSITVRDFINNLLRGEASPDATESLQNLTCQMGAVIAKMHAADVIHGDLTTSNMLTCGEGSGKSLVLIDFGLSSISSLAEDKGVDLYVLERAFLSTHPNTEEVFKVFLQSYVAASSKKNASAVISKLDEVRSRGRKREMIG